MSTNLKEQIIDLITEPLSAESCELAEVVLSQFKGSATLRLFVYTDQGATIEECARFSRLVGDLIEEAGLLESGYLLEVSSPGLDRPLKSPLDFRYRIGETVKIEFVDKKMKKRKARIVSANEDTIELRDDTETFTVSLSEVKQAKIVF